MCKIQGYHAYGNIDWTEESFSKYLGANASASTVVDEEIRLLWRSFHFYAHHPFPRHLQDGMVDFAAFHRGVLLLVFQCDELLGTRELEFYWRNEAEFFRRASFRRVFQSIGVADTTILPHATISAVSDAMDALVMVGPQYMHAAPSPRQLELVARKLLSDPVCVSARKTSRQDVFLLIGLLLCLCSRKKRWSSVCHHGDFAVKSPAQQELTESLVNSLSGETMTDQQLEGAEEVMVCHKPLLT